MNRTMLAVVFAVLLVCVGAGRQQIPTGGPIPDRRGFNNSVDDPKLTSPVEEVVRRVAGNVYVIAGARGNIEVQAGPRAKAYRSVHEGKHEGQEWQLERAEKERERLVVKP